MNRIGSIFFVFAFGFVCTMAEASVVPKNLPHGFNTIETRAALERWNSAEVPEFVGDQNYLTTKTITKNGQEWLIVYFNLYFQYQENQEAPIREKLIEQIKHTMKVYNENGSKMRVEFKSRALIQRFQDTVSENSESIFVDCDCDSQEQQLLNSLSYLNVGLLDPNSEAWKRDHKTEQSFTDTSTNTASIGTHHLSLIVHELTNLILRNADAHRQGVGKAYQPTKEDESLLADLNAKHCSPDYIDPLEIYIGLNRMGFKVPGWEDYVKSSHQVFSRLQNKIWFHKIPSQRRIGAMLKINIYDLEGKKVFHKYFSDKDINWNDEVRDGAFPDSIDIGFLKNGTYLINAELIDIFSKLNGPISEHESQTERIVISKPSSKASF